MNERELEVEEEERATVPSLLPFLFAGVLVVLGLNTNTDPSLYPSPDPIEIEIKTN